MNFNLSDYVKDTRVLGVLAGSIGFLVFRSCLSENIFPKPASTKPYGSYREFYIKRYLPEHSLFLTRVLHVFGTSMFLYYAITLDKSPIPVVLALTSAISVGMCFTPFLRGMKNGLLEMVIMLGTYMSVHKVVGGHNWQTVALLPCIAYSVAWFSHFFIEGNRPATFIYPSYSLLGDFNMAWSMITRLSPRPCKCD